MKIWASLIGIALAVSINTSAGAADEAWDNCTQEQGDWDRQISGCTQIILRGQRETQRNQIVAYYNRGRAYLEKEIEFDRIISDLNQVIRLSPKYPNAYLVRGVAYNKKGEYDRAIADLDYAIRLNHKYASAYGNRGNVYLIKGEYDRAIADSTEAIRLDPKLVFPYSNRGSAYAEKGEYDLAISDLDQAIRLNPNYVIAYNIRGWTYNLKGEYDRAISDLDQAIRINPKFSFAYSNRGRSYAGNGEYDRAISDLNEAIRLNSKSAAIYNTRGWIYRQRGEYERSIKDLDEAVRLDPKYTIVYGNRNRARSLLASRTPSVPSTAVAPPSAPLPTTAAAPSQATETPAHAGIRVALVIGNSDYQSIPRLPNPPRDAGMIAEAFRKAGFKTVQAESNLASGAMRRVLHDFSAEAEKADWAVVYYAGHGIELGGQNYIIPVDARLRSDRDIAFEAVPLDHVLTSIEGGKEAASRHSGRLPG